MSFVLKIVEGPNRGAEAALVEGVAVTIGKSDDCDIVLADSSLPDAPSKIETAADGVSIDGELLEPLHVKTLGDTSFAVGPANGPWGKLVWPKPETPEEAEKPVVETAPEPVQEKPVEETPDTKKKSHGCLIWFIVLVLLALSLAVAGYLLRGWLKPRVESCCPQVETAWRWTRSHSRSAYVWCLERCATVREKFAAWKGQPEEDTPERDPAEVIADIALAYGLEIMEEDGKLALSGNLKTRAERLAVTAEVYDVLPCAELNLSDDETLKTAVDDTLSLIGESEIKVISVTNRVVVLGGTASDPAMLISRISQEVPKVTSIDGSAIRIRNAESAPSGAKSAAKRKDQPKSALPRLPVCGILTSPYPCLVTKSGARIMEGANIGEWTVAKIEADSVVLEGPSGRFVWRP